MPRTVENEANTLFVAGLICLIGGVVGCATTHLSFSASSGMMIVGGSAMLVSFGVRDVYRATRSLYRAVRSRMGGNDQGAGMRQPLNPPDNN